MDTTTTAPKIDQNALAPETNSGQSPLIVTSNDSRSNYAQNVSKMQSTLGSISSNNPSVVDHLDSLGLPSDFNSRAALAVKYGITGYTGSSDQNTQLLNSLKTNQDSKTTTKTDTDVKTDTAPVVPEKTNPTITDTYGNKYTVGPDGMIVSGPSQGGEYMVGTNISTYGLEQPDNSTDTSTTTGDSALTKSYNDSIAGLDKGIASAKSNLDAAAATLANDPALASMIKSIQDKYDQQIELMKEKNSLLLGSYTKNAARSGALQYANDMTSDFLSEEQDKASQRLTDLVAQEQDLIVKTQTAFKNGDVKALAQAQKEYDAANKSKTDAVLKLFKATNDFQKNLQAQAKAEQAKQKQQISDDIRLSTSIAKTIADGIKTTGLKDQKDIDTYIQGMADKSGITNIDVLKSAVLKAQGDQAKTDLSAKNTQSIIDKRKQVKTTTGGGKKAYSNFTVKPTPTQITKVNAYIQSIGGNQAAIDAASSNELQFYKILNATSKSSGSGGTTPP